MLLLLSRRSIGVYGKKLIYFFSRMLQCWGEQKKEGAFRGEHEIKRAKEISSINAFISFELIISLLMEHRFSWKTKREKSQNEENEKLMIIDGVVCVVNYLHDRSFFLLYPPHRKFQIYEASSMISHSILNFLIN